MSAIFSDEAERIATMLAQADPEIVVATWGGTSRWEMTRRSDLDLLCWNPNKVHLPELTARHAAYLDLVICDDDQTGLRKWATANATDMHAVMFARRLGREGGRSKQFADVVDTLWRDEKIRAREVYHLVATSIALPRLCGAETYRPEKFALGATRCWSALAECGQLIAGTRSDDSTEDTLRKMAFKGLVSQTAASSFRRAMILRRRCEDGHSSFGGVANAFMLLGENYRACAAELIRANLPWLQRHAPLARPTFELLGAALLGAAERAALPAPRTSLGEAETMMRCFLSQDRSQIWGMVTASPYRASWWVRHAAIMNPHCSPATLTFIIDDAIRAGRLWPDRNLILYAIRHPAADQTLLERLHGIEHQLRPMDRDALASRVRIMARNTC